MSQVSCRATAAVLEVLTRWEVDVDAIVEGIPCTRAKLFDVHSRIDWDTFALFLDRVAAALDHDDARIEAVGEELHDAPAWSFALRFARRFLTPQSLARAAGFVGTALFPTVAFTQRTFDDGRMELVLSVPEHRRDARAFFLITTGQWRALPRTLGLGEAKVEAEIGHRQARYIITFPAQRTSLWRNLVGATLATPAWLSSVYDARRELRESYEAMERWRRDYHRVLDHLPDAVLIHREGKVAYANQTLTRLLGETGDGVVGRRLDEVLGWHAFQRARGACRVGGADDASRRIELGATSRCVLELRHVQVVDFNGERAELIVAQDVTGTINLEEQLFHTDRMATLGALAAGMAHEINNPLGYLLNSLQILQRDAADLEVGGTVDASWLERLRAMLGVALEGTERVRSILDDLRTFVRQDDEARPTSVHDAVEYSLEMLGGQLAGVAIRREFVDERLHVASPPARLSQVVLNLVLNAVQAVRDGGGGAVVLRILRRGASAVVEIEDDGPGMPQDVAAQAFEPFFSTKPAGVGTGLGLPISRELVHRLGGTVELDSELGRGTRVCVVLPLVVPDALGAPLSPAGA